MRVLRISPCSTSTSPDLIITRGISNTISLFSCGVEIVTSASGPGDMKLHIVTTRHDHKADRINRVRRTDRGIGLFCDYAAVETPQITNFSIDTIGGIIDSFS